MSMSDPRYELAGQNTQTMVPTQELLVQVIKQADLPEHLANNVLSYFLEYAQAYDTPDPLTELDARLASIESSDPEQSALVRAGRQRLLEARMEWMAMIARFAFEAGDEPMESPSQIMGEVADFGSLVMLLKQEPISAAGQTIKVLPATQRQLADKLQVLSDVPDIAALGSDVYRGRAELPPNMSLNPLSGKSSINDDYVISLRAASNIPGVLVELSTFELHTTSPDLAFSHDGPYSADVKAYFSRPAIMHSLGLRDE